MISTFNLLLSQELLIKSTLKIIQLEIAVENLMRSK